MSNTKLQNGTYCVASNFICQIRKINHYSINLNIYFTCSYNITLSKILLDNFCLISLISQSTLDS